MGEPLPSAALPFRLRSRHAKRYIAAHRKHLDAIVQIGATFQPSGRDRSLNERMPYCRQQWARILPTKNSQLTTKGTHHFTLIRV